MNDIKENQIEEEQREWKLGGSDWIWIFLFAIIFGGWGSFENPRISELEKKVARLEGQMSMIGGKNL